MENRTITRADLAEAVYEEVGLSRNESSDLVEAVPDEVMDTLVAGENVKISSFGSFSIREKGERIGRNPKTGEAVALSGKYVPHFKPGKELRERVNASRELPIKDNSVMVEFDLAYTKLNEKRVEAIWIDLIFEGPEMNQVTIRDVTFSRHPRADL